MLKGSIETKGKSKYRLSCKVNGYRFRQSIDAKNKKEAEMKLAVWLEKIERGELKASEYTLRKEKSVQLAVPNVLYGFFQFLLWLPKPLICIFSSHVTLDISMVSSFCLKSVQPLYSHVKGI